MRTIVHRNFFKQSRSYTRKVSRSTMCFFLVFFCLLTIRDPGQYPVNVRAPITFRFSKTPIRVHFINIVKDLTKRTSVFIKIKRF